MPAGGFAGCPYRVILEVPLQLIMFVSRPGRAPSRAGTRHGTRTSPFMRGTFVLA